MLVRRRLALSALALLVAVPFACGGAGSAPGTTTPAVEVTFPGRAALTDASRITLRGTTHLARIDAVLVDGRRASTQNGFADWSIDVPLQPGDNAMAIEFEIDGRRFALPGPPLQVRRSPLLREPVAIDSDARRAVVLDSLWSRLIDIDTTTGNRRSIALQSAAGAVIKGQAIALDGDRAFIAGANEVYTVDLRSGDTRLLSAPGPAAATTDWHRTIDVALMGWLNRLVVGGTIVQPSVFGPRELPVVVEVDILTGRRRLLAGGPLPPPTVPWLTSLAAVAVEVRFPGRILVAGSLYPGGGPVLGWINRNTGAWQIAANLSNLTAEVAAMRLDGGRALALATDGDLAEISLANGTWRVHSSTQPLFASAPTPATGLSIAGPDRVWLTYDDLHALMEMRLDGTQQRLVSPQPPLGGGPPLDRITPSLAVTPTEALVVRRPAAGSGTHAILAIARGTGDRRIVDDGTTFGGAALGAPVELLYDPATGAILALRDDEVIAIDTRQASRRIVPLATGGRRLRAVAIDRQGLWLALLAERDVPRSLDVLLVERASGTARRLATIGPQGFDLAFDDTRGQLLVLEPKAVIAVDLGSGAVAAISGEPAMGAVVGTGSIFLDARAIAVTAAGSIFVADAGHAAIVDIDSRGGHRRLWATQGSGTGPLLEEPTALAADPRTGQLVVYDAALHGAVVVHPASGDRAVMSRYATDSDPGVFLTTPAGR